MPKAYYQNTFSIDLTSGEAELFFGAELSAVPEDERPRLAIAIDKANNVTFAVEHSRGSIDFAAVARGRFLNTSDPDWHDARSDLVIGDVFHDKPKKRQLFLLWVRMDGNGADPEKYLRLGFHFFRNDSRLSGGEGDLFGAGVGQQSGGGTGGGPH